MPPTISRPDDRMLGHQRTLLLGQRAGLVEDRVRDRDLADVVQQEAEFELGGLAELEVDYVRDRQIPYAATRSACLPVYASRASTAFDSALHGRRVRAPELLRRARAPA